MKNENQLPDDTEEYLTEKLGSSVSIIDWKRTFPGASRETFILNLKVGGTPEGLVLRIDPMGPAATPYPLAREYKIYESLYGSEVPVAEPLWFDEGVSYASGRAHMVRRLVDGSTSVYGLNDPGESGDRVRRQVVRELVENLARLHSFDWETAGLGTVMPIPSSPAQALRADFEEWRNYWRENQTEVDPVLEEAMHWLLENIPEDTPRVSLTKGNNGIGEEIWQGNRIVALSDWELSCLSDGVVDLSFSEGTLQLADFDEVLRLYEHCTGESISLERVAFGGFLVWLKILVSTRSCMMKPYLEGRHRRINGLAFGLGYSEDPYGKIAACIGRNIVDTWREVVKGERSIYTGYSGA